MTTKYDFSDVVNVEDTSITLSKEFILNKVSEENIFEHYGAPIQKGLFCSKLRKDNNPTVAIYRSKSGRLLMKDFGSDFCGDCFCFVAALFNTSYYGALKIIANDFNLIKSPRLVKNKPKLQYTDTKIEKQHDAQIRVEIRD
jgi:hypothetical protein